MLVNSKPMTCNENERTKLERPRRLRKMRRRRTRTMVYRRERMDLILSRRRSND